MPTQTQNLTTRQNQITSNLEKSIIATLVYYDIFDMPLTAFEIWKYLINIQKSQTSPSPLRSRTSKYNLFMYRNFNPENSGLKLRYREGGRGNCVFPRVGRQGASSRATAGNRGCPENIAREAPMFHEILNTLTVGILPEKFMREQNGFYFLKNRNNLYTDYIARKKISAKKWKKISSISKIFFTVPFLKAAFVSGSLAHDNAKEKSDVDILIISKYKRIWTCRFLTTGILSLLKAKRTEQAIKDKFCLNHYITEKSLKIPHQSLYNAQTYSRLIPLVLNNHSQFQNLFFQFQRENNWIKERLSNYSYSSAKNCRTLKTNLFFKFVLKTSEFILKGKIGDIVEKKLKKIQLEKINNNPQTDNSAGRVICTDFQLEFHPSSPEKQIIEKYNQKMTELGFPELSNEKDSGLE